MLKFYTDFTDVGIKNFLETFINQPIHNKRYHPYTLHHTYFYLSLLPIKLKEYIVSLLEENKFVESYSIFCKILNVDQTFCRSIKESDYVVLPCMNILESPKKYFSNKVNIDLINKSKEYGKKILFFYGGDLDNFTIYYSDIILFTTGGILFEQGQNVYGCPTFNSPYVTNIFEKNSLSVSFCGFTKENTFRSEIVEKMSHYSYFNFIERTEWGGGLTDKNIKNFYENLKENLYSLCVRGGGNFSFRLGETFMMGRIPVLIDTDCIFPFKEFIPYKKNTVYVTKENSKNFTDIDSVIQKYHNSHTMEELIEIQKENMKIWYNYFTVDNAFYNTCKILENIKNQSNNRFMM